MQRYFLSLLLLLVAFSIQANNIQVSNVTLLQQDINAKTARVQFNLSWENSWRTSSAPNNWDAAWVFVKFQVGATDPSFTGASSSGTTITVNSTANLRVGMPVRVSSGTGAFAANTVISSITNATQFVVSAAPSPALSNASITCTRIWEHARLHNTDHTAATGSTIDAGLQTPASTFNETTNPAVGVFVYRSSNGTGTNTFNNMQLRWNYGANGISAFTVRVRVFAIEMVYVPEGVFSAGDGTTSSGNGQFLTIGGSTPYNISNENQITLGGSGSNRLGSKIGLMDINDDFSSSAFKTLSANFPKGFRAFYCMKYEITQGQYRDFLNTLSRSQQDTRTATKLAVGTTSVTNRYVMSNTSTRSNRNGIRCDATIDANNPINFYCDFSGNGIANQANDGEWISCNFLLWMDAAAFSDWAGLRPMTELEFEKACRGTLSAIADEFPWGTTAYELTNQLALNNIGAENEGISEGYSTSTTRGNMLSDANNNSNDGIKKIDGPVRVGIFAANALNDGTRLRTGATYYGIMEMGGNLFEQVVTLGNEAGRSFTGIHGNGGLTRSGDADVDFWPGINGNSNSTNTNNTFSGTIGVTAAAGSGRKGSSWYRNPLAGRVSHRREVNVPVDSRTFTSGSGSTILLSDNGFRAVRTAPN